MEKNQVPGFKCTCKINTEGQPKGMKVFSSVWGIADSSPAEVQMWGTRLNIKRYINPHIQLWKILCNLDSLSRTVLLVQSLCNNTKLPGMILWGPFDFAIQNIHASAKSLFQWGKVQKYLSDSKMLHCSQGAFSSQGLLCLWSPGFGYWGHNIKGGWINRLTGFTGLCRLLQRLN